MNIGVGILVASIAGCMNGLFPLPMKNNKRWAWENNWLPFSLLSLAVFPWVIAWYMVPNLAATYHHVSRTDLLAAICCGVLVYTGSLLFGIAIDRIGISLSFALLIGTMNAVGIVTPVLLLHQSLMHTRGGLWIVCGVLLSLVSVVFGFYSSKGKQDDSWPGTAPPSSNISGASLAIVGGCLSGLLPAGMATAWAHHILDTAVQFGGGEPVRAGNAVLAVVLLGGALPNCGYCVWLLRRNGTYAHYRRENHTQYWLMVLLMGILYSASVAMWGIAISPALLGKLGPSVGWALFVGMIVLTSTATGLMLGEWKHARRSALAQLAMSVALLIAAMVLICYGTILE